MPTPPDGVVEALAHLLGGAMNEAALWLAVTDEPDALERVWAELLALAEVLRSPTVHRVTLHARLTDVPSRTIP